jgi:hypothetical protein
LAVLELVRNEKELIGSLSHIYDEDFVAAVGLINDAGVGQGVRCSKVALDEAVPYLTGRAVLPPGTVKVLVRPAGSIGGPGRSTDGGGR